MGKKRSTLEEFFRTFVVFLISLNNCPGFESKIAVSNLQRSNSSQIDYVLSNKPFSNGFVSDEQFEPGRRRLSPGKQIPTSEPRPIKSSKPVGGTPLHFKEIFIARCWQYQMKIGLKDSDQINCEKVWDDFKSKFSFKGPCDVTTEDYLDFLDKIEEDIPRDKGLLWSGCRELAHKYSDFDYSKRFITLEDTLAGYIVDGLSWCGKRDPPGINYNTCPYECSIQAPYWAMANYKFARKLQGVVTILLNGTRMHLNDGKIYPTYLKDRYYFGPYVVPNINPEKVKEVNIIVAHTLRMKPLEKCNEKSVKQLQEEIAAKGIKVSCKDDPSFVKHLLCVGDSTSKDCCNKHTCL